MNMDANSAELLTQARQGNRAALELLLLHCLEPLQRHVERRVSGLIRMGISAEDIVQEAFVAAIRDIKACHATNDQSFLAWLKAISENRIRQTVRRQNAKKRSGLPAATQSDNELQIRSIPGTRERSPSSRAAVRELIQTIQAEIEDLNPEQAEATRQRYLEQQSLDDVATEMECTKGAVRGLLGRAKAKLQQTLGRSTKWFR